MTLARCKFCWFLEQSQGEGVIHADWCPKDNKFDGTCDDCGSALYHCDAGHCDVRIRKMERKLAEWARWVAQSGGKE